MMVGLDGETPVPLNKAPVRWRQTSTKAPCMAHHAPMQHENGCFTHYLLHPKKIGHHARPRRASATASLRTGADMCITGSGAGRRSGAKSNPGRRRSNHAWTEDQLEASKRKRANIDAVGGWRVHTSDDTPSRNDKIQSLQLHMPRGHTGKGSCSVEQERDNTSRASNNRDRIGRKRR